MYAERDVRTDRAYPISRKSVSVSATSLIGCIEVDADDALDRVPPADNLGAAPFARRPELERIIR